MFFVDVELNRDEALQICYIAGFALIMGKPVPEGMSKIVDRIKEQADHGFLLELETSLDRVAEIVADSPLERELCKGAAESLVKEFEKSGL